MKHQKRDLLLHFDEENQKLIFYTVDSEFARPVREREFDGAFIEMSDLLHVGADKAEGEVGELALSLLDQFSNNRIGIRNYIELVEKSHEEYVLELEQEVLMGVPEAEYSMYMAYYRKAREEHSFPLLEKAEEMLMSAAKKGNADAQKALDGDWSILKNAATKLISRSK